MVSIDVNCPIWTTTCSHRQRICYLILFLWSNQEE